jgi:Ca-activated chloride channel homolog
VRLALCTIALSILALVILAAAVQPQKINGPKDPSRTKVWLNVVVIDPRGNPVNNLSQDQFRVLEDGVPQTISLLANNQSPMVYGLAVDTSGSLRPQFETVVKAAKLLITEKRPDDKMLLLGFSSSDKIRFVQNFTTDQAALQNALDELYVESGQTAILDAVWAANKQISEYPAGREQISRSLVLITDGVELTSYYGTQTLIAKLNDGDLRIFVIGLIGEINNLREHDQAVSLLNRLANTTGGEVSYPDSPSALDQSIKHTMRQMRLGYRLGYISTNEARDDNWRRIRIEVERPPGGEKLTVQTRAGYFARKD